MIKAEEVQALYATPGAKPAMPAVAYLTVGLLRKIYAEKGGEIRVDVKTLIDSPEIADAQEIELTDRRVRLL